MTSRFKRWLMRRYDFCDRSQHEMIWKKWADSVALNYDVIKRMDHSLDVLSAHYTRQGLDLERERETNRKLIMELCILRVGPTETMDRALSLLLSGDYAKGIAELEHGIDLIRKQPSVKGGAR